MTGNSFGKLLKITTWGESHGKGVGVVIDGALPNISLSEEDIQKELDRRKPGQSNIVTPRKEDDKAQILSGVFEGKTTGTPISIVIFNKDADSSKYEDIKHLFRPGHADFTYQKKYGFRDYRGSGRSSGRETAGRVAAGVIARKILEKEEIKIIGFTKQVADIKSENFDEKEIENNPVRCADKDKAVEMEKIIIKSKEEGDSVGGIVEVIIKNVPAGIGEPVFDKLDADLAKAMMSIGAVKGVDIGAGFDVVEMKGSESNDEITKEGFVSNNSGGIIGGISTGQDIVIRIAVKPPSSIKKEQKTVDTDNNDTTIQVEGRHDPCICPRVVPIAEAMAALVIADHILLQKRFS
jgi:chorismate synthase